MQGSSATEHAGSSEDGSGGSDVDEDDAVPVFEFCDTSVTRQVREFDGPWSLHIPFNNTACLQSHRPSTQMDNLAAIRAERGRRVDINEENL